MVCFRAAGGLCSQRADSTLLVRQRGVRGRACAAKCGQRAAVEVTGLAPASDQAGTSLQILTRQQRYCIVLVQWNESQCAVGFTNLGLRTSIGS
jgi:hypothetical protein